MLTSYLNVAIALVDGRTRDALEIIRTSAAGDASGPAVARLQAAMAARVEREVNLRLHALLGKSLTIDVESSPWDHDSVLAGIKAVEDLIEGEITDDDTSPAAGASFGS